MHLGQYTHSGNFFKIGKIIPRNARLPDHSKKIYSTNIYLSSTNKIYNRKIYDILDLIGDIGGVTEVVMMVFGVFMYPITEHSFTLLAAKRLFLARTDDPEMFTY